MVPGELCAVIADIKGSRSLTDRAQVQVQFEILVGDLNSRLGPDIVARFVITTGDECQGLIRTPAPVPALIDAFARGLPACRFRFGVGTGTLSTPLKRDALGMDGPAFHRARRALETTKRAGTTAKVDSNGRYPDALLTAYLNLLDDVRGGWTLRQAQAAELYRLHGSQRLVAECLGMSQPAVARLLSRARFPLVRDAEAAFASFWARGGETP